jgi:hypothetical protein
MEMRRSGGETALRGGAEAQVNGGCSGVLLQRHGPRKGMRRGPISRKPAGKQLSPKGGGNGESGAGSGSLAARVDRKSLRWCGDAFGRFIVEEKGKESSGT